MRSLLLLVFLFGLAASSTSADAADGKVVVELNKLEPSGAGCQPYMVFENGTEVDFGSLKLDLVMFDGDGIIALRVAVDGAPLPPWKNDGEGLRYAGSHLRSGSGGCC